VLVASNALATALTLPNNIKVVNLNGYGGSGTNVYTTIAAAMAAIPTSGTTAPSATNRYLIKILPGKYVVTSPITMRAYVDIEGSGEASEINSAIAIDVDDALWGDATGFGPGNGTVVVPATISGSTGAVTVRNVKVTNTNNAGGVAILAKGMLNLEHVTASASGSPTALLKDYCGVAAEGASAAVTIQGGFFSGINNTATNPHGHNVGVGAMRGGHLTVVGADMQAKGGDWTAAVGSLGQATPSVVDVRDSTLTATPTAAGGNVIDCNNGTNVIRIIASKLTLAAIGVDSKVLGGGGDISVMGSMLYGVGGAVSEGRIGACMIDTPIDPYAKVVNCWDKNFDPIPNQ
jgi:hypothetical protein